MPDEMEHQSIKNSRKCNNFWLKKKRRKGSLFSEKKSRYEDPSSPPLVLFQGLSLPSPSKPTLMPACVEFRF